MLRLLVTFLFLVVFFLIGLPVTAVLYLVRKKDPKKAQRISSWFVQVGFTLILKVCAGTKVTVIGRERIPTDTPVLYVGNHRGFFDILLISTLTPGMTGFVAKKEMEKIPFLCTWMRAIHCLFLDRDDIKQGLKTILLGIEYIKSGTSICIFPEGTRSRGADESELLPFKEGSLKIAEKSGCPIIPVALNHTSSIFEDQLPRIKSRHVVVEFGEPIYPKEIDKEHKKFLGAYTRDIIVGMIQRNGKQYPKR